MGIEQRIESGGSIAEYVGITKNPEYKAGTTPVSKKGGAGGYKEPFHTFMGVRLLPKDIETGVSASLETPTVAPAGVITKFVPKQTIVKQGVRFLPAIIGAVGGFLVATFLGGKGQEQQQDMDIAPIITPTVTPTVIPTVIPTVTPTVTPEIGDIVRSVIHGSVGSPITTTYTPTITRTETVTTTPTVTHIHGSQGQEASAGMGLLELALIGGIAVLGLGLIK